MAVWPDEVHGKCSYGYFKISLLAFRKARIFENVEHLDYTLLGIYLFCWFQSLTAGCVCVQAACGALATSEKTGPWILEY